MSGDMAQPEVVGVNGSIASPAPEAVLAGKRKRDSMDIDEVKPVVKDAWAGRDEKELVKTYFEALRRYVYLSATLGLLQLMSPT